MEVLNPQAKTALEAKKTQLEKEIASIQRHVQELKYRVRRIDTVLSCTDVDYM